MTFVVHATSAAQEDLVAIARWIASRDPVAAARWVDSILAGLRQLTDLPRGHPTASDGKGLGVELRHLTIGFYRLIFLVRGHDVFVLHIRHGNRRIASMEDLRSALDELNDLE